MPVDPVVVRDDVIEKSSFGEHDLVLRTQHEAPTTDEGEAAFDVFKDYDLFVAKRTIQTLLKVFNGYPWAVESDTKQHLLKISIPILMGVRNWYVINLKQTELTEGAVITAGGEILERYKQRRGRMQLAQFLDARMRHSALVAPHRKVPG